MNDSDLDRLIGRLAAAPVDPRLATCAAEWLAGTLAQRCGARNRLQIGGMVAALPVGLAGGGHDRRYDTRAQLFPFVPASAVTFADKAGI